MTTDLLQLSVKESIDIIVEKSHEFDRTRKLLANLRNSIKENILKDINDTFKSPELISAESVIALLNRVKKYKISASKASEEVKQELFISINESLGHFFTRYVSIFSKEDYDIILNDLDSFNGDYDNPYYGNSISDTLIKGELVDKYLNCCIDYRPNLFKKGKFILEFDGFEGICLKLKDFDFVIKYCRFIKETHKFDDIQFEVPDFLSIIQSITEIE